MDPTTAIIQFIGIVLFSAAVPDDPGLHAIIPRIGHVHKSEFHNLPPEEAPENLASVGKQEVENHISVIMYRDEDKLYNVGGWRADGDLANGWKYLALNGERIRFISDGSNGDTTVPPVELPRVGVSSSCSLTGAPVSLNEEFLPPYRGAIAVVDIPEGKLSACATAGRRDTRLLLDTNGVLVITATKKFEEPKALMLKGNAVVFVANIPPYAMIKATDLKVGAEHWTAYNAMLAAPCAAEPKATTASIDPCDLDSLGESYLRAQKNAPIVIASVDSGCSNSQTP